MKTMEKKYDVIIVGSGIGGSTAALLLSKFFKKKVLIIEKHWTFGGLTHEFEFDNKKFATGVHYIGAVNNHSVPDKVFNIITGGNLRWITMPFRYDEVIFPGYSYAIPSSEETFVKELSEKYPSDSKAIKRFVRHSKIAFRFLAFYMSFRSFAPKILQWFIPFIKTFMGFNVNSSLKEYLDKRFESDELKNILGARWCDYGVIPEEASFMANSMIFNHYLKGAFYPEGGVSTLVNSIEAELKRSNVDILLSTEVKSILVNNKAAFGVDIMNSDGKTENILANQVISNIGAASTYTHLLEEENFSFIQRDLDKLYAKYDFFTIYISLKESPIKLGFDGSNKWIFNTDDQTKVILNPSDKNYPAFYCLLFPSLKAKDPINHTMEILTMIDYESVKKWSGQEWKNRSEEYYSLKSELATKIFTDIENKYPGFRDLISDFDTSTPLTTEKFISRSQGSSYGIPSTTNRYHLKWLSNKTPIKNLYLSGQDTIGPGVMGAMMGGVSAAALTLGSRGYMKIMKHINADRQLSDDVTTRYFPVNVIHKKSETSEATSFKLNNPYNMQYKAGQFIILNACIDGEYHKRAYSLSSYPDEQDLTITIKRVEHGLVSNFMIDEIQKGDSIYISEPKGDLVLGENDVEKDILFIAAGSGITPIYSLINDTLENQIYSKLHLLYSNRAPEETIFKEELDTLSKKYSEYFSIDYHYSRFSNSEQLRKRLTIMDIEKAVDSFDVNNLQIFVCAPESLVRSAWEVSRIRGLSINDFHFESFSTKSINLLNHDIPSHDAELVYKSKRATFDTKIKGGNSLLEGLIENNVPIDYSCMSGDCGLCKCRIIDGQTITLKKEKVTMSNEGDEILPCVSYAQSKKLVLDSLN